MKEEPPPEFKSRDKFLVQSVAVPAEAEIHNVAAIVCDKMIPTWHGVRLTGETVVQHRADCKNLNSREEDQSQLHAARGFPKCRIRVYATTS